MNIIIPMAGKGQRFKDAGYVENKPFIDVLGKPMLQVALENLNLGGTHHFLVNQEDFDGVMDIIKVVGITDFMVVVMLTHHQGAAAACLHYERYMSRNDALVVANCDQIINWPGGSSTAFIDHCRRYRCHGALPTFEAKSTAHSYARTLCDSNTVVEVAEKVMISTHALCGVHYWRNTYDAMWSFESAMKGLPHYNNDYYIAPTYNELLKLDRVILRYPTDGMTILGTPEKLEEYIENSSTNIGCDTDTE